MRKAALLVVALTASFTALAVDTTIKGGRMELVDKGEVVYFSGGVRLDRGPDRLTASEMRTNKRRDKINAKGDVHLTRVASATETWKAFGDSGFYDTRDGSGYLIGKVKRAHVTRTEALSSTITRTTDIYADRIDFMREGQRAFAQGNVYGKTVDPQTGDVFEFQSQEAEHLGDQGRMVLTGPTERPVVTQTTARGTKRVTGKTIIYYIDARRLVSKENAEAFMRQEKN